MRKKDIEILYCHDGIYCEELTNDYLLSYPEYFEITKEGVNSKFVGFIILEDLIIVSLPKGYESHENSVLELFKVLSSKNIVNIIGGSRGKSSNFPLKDYLNICNYYVSNGIYVERKSVHTKSLSGNINWNRTFIESDMLILNESIFFVPFIVNEKQNDDVYITYCMKVALSTGYMRFGKYFNIGIPYPKTDLSSKIFNEDMIIYRLEYILRSHNGDLVKSLIRSLINYFKWLVDNSNEGFFLTTNFEYIWEYMVGKLVKSKLVIKNDEIVIDYRNSVKNNFIQNYTHKIQVHSEGRDYSVRYDHLLIGDDYAIIIDAKYYKDSISSLDYKQFSYTFLLEDYLFRKKNKTVNRLFNALVLPTNKNDYIITHIDMSSDFHINYIRKNIINEYYLNVNIFFKWFLSYNN